MNLMNERYGIPKQYRCIVYLDVGCMNIPIKVSGSMEKNARPRNVKFRQFTTE